MFICSSAFAALVAFLTSTFLTKPFSLIYFTNSSSLISKAFADSLTALFQYSWSASCIFPYISYATSCTSCNLFFKCSVTCAALSIEPVNPSIKSESKRVFISSSVIPSLIASVRSAISCKLFKDFTYSSFNSLCLATSASFSSSVLSPESPEISDCFCFSSVICCSFANSSPDSVTKSNFSPVIASYNGASFSIISIASLSLVNPSFPNATPAS